MLPLCEPPRELTTPRLLLRGWREDDLPIFSAMNADPDVMRFFPDVMTPAQSEEMLAVIRQRFVEYGWGLWAVERRDSGDFIGFIGLNPAPERLPFSPAVEIGWRLLPQAWGQGLAPEGAGRVLTEAFTHFALPAVVAFTAKINHPSRRVMEKCGMSQQGEFEHPRVPELHPLREHVWYRLTREHWQDQG
ncbi:GNAT family N-acetyltransferase [Pantoea sp. 1.19]|uniref:GNAT family N-acetyltransferase n=1 Tax=Pantoea sp. 1.19 TaxID=1925589 RepID=UPI000948DE64|nr:GNAT family N-acetyltransferase [Pantoea sp. 1.19]